MRLPSAGYVVSHSSVGASDEAKNFHQVFHIGTWLFSKVLCLTNSYHSVHILIPLWVFKLDQDNIS